jgi:hypothetical protein
VKRIRARDDGWPLTMTFSAFDRLCASVPLPHSIARF